MGSDAHTSRRVAINAQFVPGGFAGGVEKFTAALVRALGALPDGEERYVVVAVPGFEAHSGFEAGTRVATVPGFVRRGRRFRAVELLPPGVFRALRALAARLRGTREAGVADRPALPDGAFFDALGAGVVHFPFQSFFRTAAPSIFHPHDLQHLHFPQFFTGEELAARARVYPAACETARAVVVESRWVKDDVCRNFGIAEAKVLVIPIGAPASGTPAPGAAVASRGAPAGFVLYPAQTWPHKNHLALLEALRLLRDRDGISLPLVCTGRKNAYWPTIRIREDGRSHTPSEIRPPRGRERYSAEDLIAENIAMTPSVMFRTGLWRSLPPFMDTIGMIDWPLHIINASFALVQFIDRPMATYRVHKGGAWSGTDYATCIAEAFTMSAARDQHLINRYRRAFVAARRAHMTMLSHYLVHEALQRASCQAVLRTLRAAMRGLPQATRPSVLFEAMTVGRLVRVSMFRRRRKRV